MRIHQKIIAVFLSIIIGLIIGLSEIVIFNSMIIGLMFLLGILLSIIVLIGGIIKKRKSTIKTNFGIMSLFLLCGISILISSNLKKIHNQNKANEIVKTLEKYKKEFGRYPEKIEAANHLKYNYRTDSIQSEFKLTYLLDEWHNNEYSSSTKNWITKD